MIHSGVDLISIKRLKKILKENEYAFLKRICTEREMTELLDVKRRDERIAAYFSLKEAFSKAVGTGIGEELSFHDIEVSYTEKGQPKISYIGKKFTNLHKSSISCSVSHEDELLLAFVVILGDL